MKRIAFAVVAIMLPFSFAGCGQATEPSNPSPEDASGRSQVFNVNTPNGTYQCISWDDGYAGGLSCDKIGDNNGA